MFEKTDKIFALNVREVQIKFDYQMYVINSKKFHPRHQLCHVFAS